MYIFIISCLDWEIFQKKVVEKLEKTHFEFGNFIFPKTVPFTK